MALGKTQQTRARARHDRDQSIRYAVVTGLSMRERAGIRDAHPIDTVTPDGGAWVVACGCGWSMDTRAGAGAAGDLHGMHVDSLMMEAAAAKRAADRKVERALEEGRSALLAIAEADGAVVSIAPTGAPWFVGRPGGTAHLILDGGNVGVCGAHVGFGFQQRARAYTRKCPNCVTVAGGAS